MKSSFLSLTIGLLSALLLPATAGEFKLPKEKPLFSIKFPDKWTVTHEDESVDGISEDESIELYAQTDDSETIEDSVKESIDYLTGEGVKIDPATKKDNEGIINGMTVKGVNWSGTDADGPCRISLSFIDVGAEQVITLLYWGSVEAEKEHAKELESIMKSMKSLNKTKPAKKEAAQEKEEK